MTGLPINDCTYLLISCLNKALSRIFDAIEIFYTFCLTLL